MVKFTPFGVFQKIFGSPDLNQNKDDTVNIIHSDGKISIKSKVCVRQKSTNGTEKVTTYSQTDKTTDYSYESVLGKKYSSAKNVSKIYPETPLDGSFKQQNDGSQSNDTHFVVHDFTKSVSKAKVDQSTNNAHIYAVYRTVSDLKEELTKKCVDSANNAECEKCYCDHCGAITVIQDSLKHPLAYENRGNVKVSEEIRRKYRKYKRIKTVTEDPAFVKLVEQCNKLEVKVTLLEENLIVRESKNSALRLMYDMYTQSSTTSIQATDAIPKNLRSFNASKPIYMKKDESKIFCLPKKLFRNRTPKSSSKAQMTEPISPKHENQFHINQIPRKRHITRNRSPSPVNDSLTRLNKAETSGQTSRIPRITRPPGAVLASFNKIINNDHLNLMPRKHVTPMKPAFKLRSQDYMKKDKSTSSTKQSCNTMKLFFDSEKPYESESTDKKSHKFRSRFAQFRQKDKSQISLSSTEKVSTSTSPLDLTNFRKNHEDIQNRRKSFMRDTTPAETKTICSTAKYTSPIRVAQKSNQTESFDRSTRAQVPHSSRAAASTPSPEMDVIKSKILDLIMANYESNKILSNMNMHRSAVRTEISQMLKIYENDDLNKIVKILEQSAEKTKNDDNASIDENIVRIQNYQDENDKDVSETKANAIEQKRSNVKTEPIIKISTKKVVHKTMDKHVESWSIHPEHIPSSNNNSIASDKSGSNIQIQQEVVKHSIPSSIAGNRLNSNVYDAKNVSFSNEEYRNISISKKDTPIKTKRECKISKPIVNTSAFDTSAVSDTSDNSSTLKLTSGIPKRKIKVEKKRSKIIKKETIIPKLGPPIEKQLSKIPIPVVPIVKSGPSTPSRSRSRSRGSTKAIIPCEKSPKLLFPQLRIFQRNRTEERKPREKPPPAKKPPFISTKYCVESPVIKPWVTTKVDTGRISTRTPRPSYQRHLIEESPLCKATISDISTLSFNEARQYLNNRMSLLEETAEKIQLLSYDFKEAQ